MRQFLKPPLSARNILKVDFDLVLFLGGEHLEVLMLGV